MKRDALHLLIGILCGLLLAGVLRYVAPAAESDDLDRYREVRDFVRANYVDEVEADELLDSALHGMIEHLDAYSRYLDPTQVGGFERETQGRYRGIGVVFRPPLSDGQVLFALQGSPAERAGVRAGDRVLAVDGTAVAGLASGELQQRIANAEGDKVRLTLRSRAGAEREVEIERTEIVDPTVRHARIVDSERGIGYLAITSFSHETADEFDRAIESLQRRGLRALIVDVRGNPGGVLVSAVRIVNRFVPRGIVVTTEGRGEKQVYEATEAEARHQGMPLVVLGDGDSASASEVLAAALQDWRAAVLVGSPTYGKGMVQKVKSLWDHRAAVKLTCSYYFSPSHRNFERTLADAWEYGLLPDLAVDVDVATQRRVHTHLATYGPPESAEAELVAWEAEDGVSLFERHPDDPQLDAALALLRGEQLAAAGGRGG